MKIRRIMAFFTLIMFCITMCFVVLSPTAYALLEQRGSITLTVIDRFTFERLPGASFRLYFFAYAYEKSNGVGFEYVVPYDDCQIDMGNLQDAYLPVHLSYFASTHNLPYTEKTSDSQGEIVFESLVPGVYLLVPSNNVENYIFSAPFVIDVPEFDAEKNNWKFDVTGTPKLQAAKWNDNQDRTYISVKKQWNTNTTHPDEVTVKLLCDLKEIDTVILNEENNWYYRWDNLAKNHLWSVVEAEVPDGFTVSYEASEHVVNITNTLYVPGPSTTVPETTKPEELIDTGQLNWPVPVLSITGILLFSLGWAMLNISKKEKK